MAIPIFLNIAFFTFYKNICQFAKSQNLKELFLKHDIKFDKILILNVVKMAWI